MKSLDETVSNIADWHHERNLVDGASHNTQFKKLLEEVVEIYCAANPKEEPIDVYGSLKFMLCGLYVGGRIKQGGCIKDAIGDSLVVLVNHAEREGASMAECAELAYNEIKDRSGRMVDGVYMKEADL